MSSSQLINILTEGDTLAVQILHCFLYTYISSTCTPLQPLTMSWNSTWHMCNGHPYQNKSKKNTKKTKNKNQKNKKNKKTKKSRLHTPRGGGQMQRVGVCNLVFFVFFCFFVFLFFWFFVFFGSLVCFGRIGKISGKTLLFATFTLSGFANLCSVISCLLWVCGFIRKPCKNHGKMHVFLGETKGPGAWSRQFCH